MYTTFRSFATKSHNKTHINDVNLRSSRASVQPLQNNNMTGQSISGINFNLRLIIYVHVYGWRRTHGITYILKSKKLFKTISYYFIHCCASSPNHPFNSGVIVGGNKATCDNNGARAGRGDFNKYKENKNGLAVPE